MANKILENISKKGLLLWVVFHAIVLILGGFSPWNIDADLYSILPDSHEIKNVKDAETFLSSRSVKNFSVLVGHKDFKEAKKAAEFLHDEFESALQESRLFVNENDMADLQKYFFDYRYVLENKYLKNLLENESYETIKNLSLQRIYGAFSIADLSQLDEDPFLLSVENFEYYTLNSQLTKGKFTLKENVLTAYDSSVNYVMWNGVLSNKTSAMAGEGHVFDKLYKSLDSLKLKGLKIEKSGVPFHSYESSKNAEFEVALISGISILLILILLLYVFKTPLPIFCILATIGIAILTALSVTWFAFKNIHVFTFVFGTSVIGVSLDYAVHFFTDWKMSKGKNAGILKGLFLGFMTTEFSYLALNFAGFYLLKQMAVFSMAGLMSAFLTIVLLFPQLKFIKKSKNFSDKNIATLSVKIPPKFLNVYDKILQKNKIYAAGILAVITMVVGAYFLNINTDMRTLYTMSDELKNSESLNAKLNNLGISANYFIVEGNSVENLLQNEEELLLNLKAAQNDSLLKDYLAVSEFMPSKKTQQYNFEKSKKLLESNVAKNLENDLKIKIKNPTLNFIKMDSIPGTFKNIMDMLWVGNLNGKFYSAVFPLHVSKNFDGVRLAKKLPFVYAVNKIENVNKTLTELSRKALLLVALAYLVVFVVLLFVYGFRGALKVIWAPVISALFTASVFGFCGIPFNFFAIVGVILTLGIGIDYTLFFKEGGAKNMTTALAVMVSALTTVISFGSLYLSSFTPVSTFGLSVLLGITCCFLLSPLSRR